MKVGSQERAGRAAELMSAAARCWRAARDAGAPVQQRLHAVLGRRGCGVLAPVFDSLLSLYEAALGRRIMVGTAALSADERLLIGLLDGTVSRRQCLTCPRDRASALDCAICSTRIMIGLAVDD